MNASSVPLQQPPALSSPESLSELLHEVAGGRAEFTDLIASLSPLICDTEALTPPMALAMAVTLGEIDRQSRDGDQAHVLVDRQSAPAVALLGSGVVAAANAAARQLFGITPGESHEALGINRAAFHAFRSRLFEYQGPSLLKVAPLQIGQPTLVMVGSYQQDARIFLLTVLQHSWPDSIDRALEDLFGLSLAEREVLAGLAQGGSAESIAAQRQRSLGTVRQQIKSILQKLDARTQVQAASFAAAAANAVSESGRSSDRLQVLESSTLTTGELTREGRRVGWRRYGRVGGHPVLLLHGPFFGVGEYEFERQLSAHFGLDVFAVERPGYGRTDPPMPQEDAVQCQVEDILLLLDRQGLEGIQVLCHDIAFLPALVLCERAGERVHSLTAVSAPAPLTPGMPLDPMPVQQRLFISAARHTAWLVRLLIRLGMSQMRKLGPERWIEPIFGEVPAEMALLRTPEFACGLPGAYAFNLSQSALGFEMDVLLTARDWTETARALRHPCTLFYGSENRITRPGLTSRLAELNERYVLRPIEGAGQTLALTHCETILAHLASERRDG